MQDGAVADLDPSGWGRVARPLRRLPGLDGLRALAVVAAMLFHAGVVHGGFLGVDLFFVLSGFLITSLLLSDAAGRTPRPGPGQLPRHARVRLGAFWVRRVRRLAPALLVVIAVSIVWSYAFASPALAQSTTKEAAWSLFNLNNWFALFGNVGYWGANVTQTPLNHIWSLAIEEQFYLVWPVVLALLISAFRTTRTVGVVAALALVSSAGWQWWAADHYGPLRAYLGTDTRASALFVGCLLAVVMARTVQGPETEFAYWPERLAWSVAAFAAAGWLAFSWTRANFNHVVLYHGWLISCSVAGGVIITALVLNPRSFYTRALEWGPVVWIGKRSYSLYLWHLPIWVMLGPSVIHNETRMWVVRVAVTVAVSAASYSWLELPIRRGHFSAPRVLSAVLVAAGAMSMVVTLFPPTLPRTLSSQPVTLTGTGGAGSLTVLVAGDSWAQNMGYALHLADTANHDTILNEGVPGCGLLGHSEGIGCSHEEVQWNRARQRNAPDVAVLMDGTVESDDGAVINGRRRYPCDQTFDAAFAQALDRTIGVLKGTSPIPVYVATVRESETGHPQRSHCINDLIRAAVIRDAARLADLHGLLCPHDNCPSRHDGQSVYDDTGHLGPGGQRWAGSWLLNLLHSGVRGKTIAAAAPGPCTGASAPIRLAASPYVSQPDPEYPDQTARELTNHRLGRADISDPAWQGWHAQTASVTFTLKSAQPVCAVTSTWLQALQAAVYIPSEIDVYVAMSLAGPGHLLGVAQGAAPSTKSQRVAITVTGTKPVTGRYVIVQAAAGNGWVFTDEMTLYGPTKRR